MAGAERHRRHCREREQKTVRTKRTKRLSRESERKPGRSAGSSRSKAKARGESSLKGLVIGAVAGSSNASRRASLVGFSFLIKLIVGFFAVVLFSVFRFAEEGVRFAEGGEGRSLAEIRRRLPLVGDGAGRSIEVFVLSLCAVWICTGVCATLRAAAARVVRGAKIGDDGVTAVAAAGTSVAGGRTKRTSALDRSTEMGEAVGAVGEGGSV